MGALRDMAHAKKKKWVQGAIGHPGSLTAAAKRNNRTTLQEAKAEEKSSNPHIRSRGYLGERLIKRNL